MTLQPSEAMAARFATHQVDNLPSPLEPYDAWATDVALRETITREGGGWAAPQLAALGALVGSEMAELATLANRHRPQLKAFDRYGRRIDEVEFHPAYHRLMSLGMAHGVSGFAWRHQSQVGAHVARMGLAYLYHQADQGTGCPLTMTYACVPTLEHQPSLASVWRPLAQSTEYDARAVPATAKRGVTVGMGMTEKQGGSDVRSNTTRAHPVGSRGPGELYELVGHKWFFSAPMSDAFLVLAQEEGGLSCFLMPRYLPDGRLNAIRIQRLKDKLGDWSNASGEVELQGAIAHLVGEPGRGVATILEMVALTRQDCMIGSSALMRQALVQAIHHCRQRRAFGKRLSEQPLMQNVLADLALESEAHLALSARVARAVDASGRDEREAAFARVATAVGKYWVCKRAAAFVNEAQECLGGLGYVEDSPLPRLYRQAPLNSIWEGSGNIQCLDVLRALKKDPACREALLHELRTARGDARLDAEVSRLERELADVSSLETRARGVIELLAIALQASLLVRAGNIAVSDAFVASRISGQHGATFGTLPASIAFGALIDRALLA